MNLRWSLLWIEGKSAKIVSHAWRAYVGNIDTNHDKQIPVTY